MLISGRAGDGTCGVGDYSLFLAAELAREVEVDLLHREGHGPRQEYLNALQERPHLRLVALHDFGSGAVGTILRLVRQRRPDVVHLQYPAREYRFSLMPLWLAWFRSRLCPARFVLTLHEYSAAHPLRRLAGQALIRSADQVLLPALAEFRALKRRFPRLPLSYVPNGCFFATLAGSAGMQSGGEREPIVLYFGLPSKTKSFDRLARLLKAMREAGAQPELKLHFVGKLPSRSPAAAFFREWISQGFIEMHPFLPLEKLRQLAESSLLLLFPFEFDTHRSSLINALAWDAPIACFGCAPGIAEEYAGMLPLALAADDDEGVPRRLGDFLNLLHADFASAAREQLQRQRALRERLDMSRIAQQHLSVYNQALRKKAS